MEHWKGAFGKLSAKELFSAVDADNDGEITLEEFLRFWESVKNAGRSEEAIMEELDNLKRGEAWVAFKDVQPVPSDLQQASARRLRSGGSESPGREGEKEVDKEGSNDNVQEESHVKFSSHEVIFEEIDLPYSQGEVQASPSGGQVATRGH